MQVYPPLENEVTLSEKKQEFQSILADQNARYS